MEPRREEQQEVMTVSAGPKPKRFRIVRLEERIAPNKGGHATKNCPTGDFSCFGCWPSYGYGCRY
jgi:hypothetical protein